MQGYVNEKIVIISIISIMFISCQSARVQDIGSGPYETAATIGELTAEQRNSAATIERLTETAAELTSDIEEAGRTSSELTETIARSEDYITEIKDILERVRRSAAVDNPGTEREDNTTKNMDESNNNNCGY